MKIEKEGELVALLRALNFIKFKCIDPEVSQFVGSPLIGSLLEKVILELNSINMGKGLPVRDLNINIGNFPQQLNIIKHHIQSCENWNSINENNKRDFVKILISPFKYDDSLLDKLIEEGNAFHKLAI